MTRLHALLLAALVPLAGCAPAAPRAPAPAPGAPLTGTLPPVPAVAGPLAIDVVYPEEGGALAAVDSTFVFGSVGTGEATLRVNGQPVQVAPNGAFLAFLPVPGDGVYRLEATSRGATVTATRNVRVPAVATGPVPELGDVIVQGTVAPAGALAALAGEPFDVRFRAAPGVQAQLRLPDGTVIPFVPRAAREAAPAGFMQDGAAPPAEFTEYVALFELQSGWIATDTAVARPRLADAALAAGQPAIEIIRGTDTIRQPVGASVAVLRPGEERVAVAASQRLDRSAIGTAVPGPGTPWYWFFPNGTRMRVTGERGDLLRVQLTRALSVWVQAAQVQLLPPGTRPARGTAGSIRVAPEEHHIDIRIALTERLPYLVTPGENGLTIDIYGAESRTNWMYQGVEDDYFEGVDWHPVSDELYRVDVRLRGPVWGYTTMWSEPGHLVVRVRRPPRIDPRRPLAGLVIAVDAGHPPGGATGPTRLTEADANLMITRRLVPLLERAGARVLEIRPDTATVALAERPQLALDANAHLLVSVHNNAFPDGVNPFRNAGTSVLYTQPHSLELARFMQRELVRELGLRDLGVIYSDLAMTRPTWMPAVLTESMFMMVPEQEAALRDPRVQERLARAHVRALEAFLRDRAGR
jgi:N-acetylmuramoyl-L-alanine amidase